MKYHQLLFDLAANVDDVFKIDKFTIAKILTMPFLMARFERMDPVWAGEARRAISVVGSSPD